MAAIKFADSVFINCPFDPDYWPLLEVIVFTVIACGFVPRSSLEEADGGDIRIAKIAKLIAQSRYGIHDLSRIELDADGFPRFNMPFELGIDWSMKHYGTPQQRQKKLLLLERDQHTLKRYLSDCGGQDPVHHGNSTEPLVRAVRRFLTTSSKRTNLPGELTISEQFRHFSDALPGLCTARGLDPANLHFVDYVNFIPPWLAEQNKVGTA